MSDVEDAVNTTEDEQILDDQPGPTFYNPNGDELVEKSKQKSIEELLTPKRVFPNEKPWLKKKPTPAKEIKLEDNSAPVVHEQHTSAIDCVETPESSETSEQQETNETLEEDNNVVEVPVDHSTVHDNSADAPTLEERPIESVEYSHEEDQADVTEEYHEEPEASTEHVSSPPEETPHEASTPHEELVHHEDEPSPRNEETPVDHDSIAEEVTHQETNHEVVEETDDVTETVHEVVANTATEDVTDTVSEDQVSQEVHEENKDTDHHEIMCEELNDYPTNEDITPQHNDNHDESSQLDKHELQVEDSNNEENVEKPRVEEEDIATHDVVDENESATVEDVKINHEEQHNVSQEDKAEDEQEVKEPPKQEKEVPAAKPAASKLAKPKTGIPKISTTKTTATAAKPKEKSKLSAPSPRTTTSTAAKKTTEKLTTTTASAKKTATAATKTDAKPKAEPAKPKTTAATSVKPKEAMKVEPKAAKPKTPRTVTTTSTATKVAPKAEKPKTPRTVTSTTTTAKASTIKATAATTKAAPTASKPKETKTAPANKTDVSAKPKTPRATTTTVASAKASTTAIKTEKPSATTSATAKPKLTPVTVPSTSATAAKAAPKPASVKTPRTATATAAKAAEKPAAKATTTATSAKPKETKPATAKAGTKAEKPAASSAKAAAPKATAKKAEKAPASNTNAKTSATKAAPAKGAKATATKAAAKKTSGTTAKTKAAPAKGAKNSPAKAGAKKSADGKTKTTAKVSGTTTAAASGSVPKPGLTTARKPTGAQNRRKPTVNPIQGMKSLEQHTQQNKSNVPETPHKRMIQLRHVATPTSKEKLATFSLYKIQGRKILIPEKVELKFQSLHVNCAFVLDTKDKIFVWYGPEANRMEKAFAVDFAKRLKDEDNMGRSQTFTIGNDLEYNSYDTNRIIGECKEEIEDEFWNYLSGEGEIPSHEEKKYIKPHIQLFRIKDQIEKVEGDKFMKEVLNDLFCFVMDCPNEVYCWMGKNTSDEVRNKASEHAKALLAKKKLKWVKVEKLVSGVPEPVSFKVKFANWGGRLPIATGPAPMPAAKKRIPLTKYDVNKLFNRPQKPKEVVVDDGSGKTLMWIVRRGESNEKVPLAKKDYGHFFSGESYLILYTYTIKNTEHKMIYFWQGRNSTIMDKGFSAVLTIDLDDKLGGEAKQIRVVQGKEPQHFLKIFGGLMVVHKGKYNAEENYLNKTKLYQLKGSFELGTLLEVEPRLRNVNVNESMVLTTPLKTYFMRSPYNEISFNAEKLSWCKDTELIEFSSDQMNDDFVDVLGLAGSGEKFYGETYPWLYSDNEESNSNQEYWPILYQAQIVTGQFKIEEIFDFTQDDLIDRDVFILDCKDTIWVWFGKNSVPTLQQLTLETLLDYVDKHPMGERLGDPINIIKSGLEPLDFTVHFFGWEYAKNSNPQANSANIRPMEEVLELIKKKYTYHELIKSPPEYCDKSKLELYMTDEEFERIFDMNKEEFENLSDWKRIELKKQKQLF